MATMAANFQTGSLKQRAGDSILFAAKDEQLLDRVYDFPEALPEKAMDMLVEMASDDEVSNKEMDYIYFIVVTLPLMATSGMFKDQKNWFLKENRCSFKDYIRYRLNKLNYMASNGYDRAFCERIRQLLWRFTVV
ncbi:MAG: hypothetical protein C0602_01055 [Denitrovibrio sp.]|nr:MAG: hypothetical protein C0602_01055 [Denitrovibrio sp.]